MKTLLFAIYLFGFSTVTYGGCADILKKQINFAYNDGGLKITNMVGPIHWNESIKDQNGNYGLSSIVGFAISYDVDKEILPQSESKNVFITAECTHEEPSVLVDQNNDGIFDLSDTITKGN